VDLPLDRIRTDGGTQARAGLDEPTVTEYAEALEGGAVFPPIVVFHDAADYWLADGFHRVAAALRAGLKKFPVEVRQGTRREALLFACGANYAHGLRRTQEDKRQAVLTLLRDDEWGQRSDRWVADAAKVDHKTVAKLRTEAAGRGEIPTSRGTRTDTRGRQQPASKTRTAAPPSPALPRTCAELLALWESAGEAERQAFLKAAGLVLGR
jgi:ParB-like nuclease domain